MKSIFREGSFRKSFIFIRINMSYNRGGRNKHTTVYTDGSCRNNGYDGATGGIGGHWPDHQDRDFSKPLYGKQTNNRAEIQAAHHAISQAKEMGYTDVTVKTDSEYLAKGATSWGDRWERNGYRTASGGPVQNRDDWQALRQESQGITVRYEHVPGHSGDPGNERADRLANQGATKGRRY